MKTIPLLAACVVAAALASTSSGSTTTFRGSVTTISPALARQMTGVSWKPGCPVPLRDLRVVTATHRGFDGRDRTGRLIVHRDVATEMLGVLRRLYADGFPIRRMVPIDAYGGSDFRSIEADNTSAFNCRFVDGTTRYSGTTSHPASRSYVQRTPFRPGMAAAGRALVRAFDAAGWGWGGRWSGAKDYQHFSASGR
jgi:hypothetical protein